MQTTIHISQLGRIAIVFHRRDILSHIQNSTVRAIETRRFAAQYSATSGMDYVLPNPSDSLADACVSSTTSLVATCSKQQIEISSAPFEDLEPQEPGPEDCCQQGCRNCVWKIYHDRHHEWAKRNGKVVESRPAESMLERLERDLEAKAKARRAQVGQ